MENKEKPILFNTEMVRAILAGQKTCTRRLPNKRVREEYFEYDDWANTVGGSGIKKLSEKEFYEQYPPYQVGDILYVRETWGEGYEDGTYIYKASDKLANHPMFKESSKLLYHPSIHMPKEAARIWLRVVDVQLERLQDISNDEAIAEGAQGIECDHVNADPCGCTDCMNTGWIEPPIVGFMQIWDGTIKKSELDLYGWKANPWVWVIEFERCDKEGRKMFNGKM
ncbi:hypothetical protein LI187_09030 [bacterium 210820-DFI.6.38]|nr:hypothetical protein [bacterium 210820-DFI.6.38]